MNSRVSLVVIGILIIVSTAVTADLGMRRPQETLDAEKAALEDFARSILDWETIVSVIPEAAGYEGHEDTSIRGKPAIVIITPDSPLLWSSERGISESGPDVPGRFRCFSVQIGVLESEAAMEEEIQRNVLWGCNVQQEGQVTTGFFEQMAPFWDGRDRNVLEAFAVKGRLEVRLVVVTYFDGSEGEPFAGRAELERLIELVKERLINIGTLF